MISVCYWAGHVGLGIFFRLFHRHRVLHVDRIPRTGGLILASNHASFLDPPVLGTSIPNRGIYFVARDTLFRNPVFGQIIRWCHSVPIERGKGGKQNWDVYVRMLNQGKALLIFPEGTRTETGALQPGKSGFGKIVYLSRKPVYPAYVHGSFQAYPKGGRHRCYPITVIFGQPVPLDDLLAQPEDARVYKEISRRTMEAIAGLKAELERQKKS